MNRCERCDRPVTPWDADREAAAGECPGGGACDGTATDWRARALAAEAALANAQGMEGLAVSMWNEVETAARSAASGDDEPPRSVATDCGLDLFLCVQNALADAEARGRQHGLLAAAWRLTTIADGIEGTAVAPTAQRAMREAARVVVALATESA